MEPPENHRSDISAESLDALCGSCQQVEQDAAIGRLLLGDETVNALSPEAQAKVAKAIRDEDLVSGPQILRWRNVARRPLGWSRGV